MARIQFEHVTKRYGRLTAVDEVSFVVGSGKVLVLLGASGCGKTTTLRLIGGLERPDGGTITLDGKMVAGPSTWVQPEQRRIGFVFQDYALFPHLSVQQNVTFGLKDWRGDKSRRAGDMLELVGLGGLGSRMPHQLSGGQQQRVALARALAPEPAILLLDEPFSNLDAALRVQVRSEVRDILDQTGVTSVFVTHDQEEALSLADQVAVMVSGEIVQIGSPQTVYIQPATREVAAFVGEANFIPGDAEGDQAWSPLGVLPLAESAHGAVDLMLRPEAIALSEAVNGLAATVEHVEFFGHDQRVRVKMDDDRQLIARLDAWQRFAPGQRVGIAVTRPVQAFDRQ